MGARHRQGAGALEARLVRLERGEAAILVHALAAYRALVTRGDLPEPEGGMAAIDSLQNRLELAIAGDAATEAYQGIRKRTGDCFCRTCRMILESQLRDVLARLPDDQRHNIVDRVSSSLGS